METTNQPNGGRPCRCPDCGAIYQTDDQLQQHREAHGTAVGGGECRCPDCHERFDSDTDMRAHRALHTVLTE